MEKGWRGEGKERKFPEEQAVAPAEDSGVAVEDDDVLEVDTDSTAGDDMQQGLRRFLEEREATRTLYHQRRADNDTINSTRSLYDTDIDYYEIYGRTYCGEYYMPCDEDEQTRMNMLHEVYLYILGGRLTTAPLDSPTKILDVGTGCGDWPIAMGEQYPGAEVIGIDIAKLQPSAVPQNVFFEIADAEEELGWTYAEDSFDLVHFRTMMGAFKDWTHVYKETYQHLKPGGWIEVLDFDDHKAMLSYFPRDGITADWLAAVAEGSRKAGRARGIRHLEHEMLTDLGFVDVTTEQYSIPMGVWPDDPAMKKTGHMFMLAQMCGVVALCWRVLIEQMGWDPAEVVRVCEIVTAETKNICLDGERAKGLGLMVRVLKGRKPTLEEQDRDVDGVSTVRNGGEF